MIKHEKTTKSAMESWSDGVELRDAWYHLADDKNKIRYRNSESAEAATNFVEIEMRMDLRDRIECGELLAFGIQPGQKALDGPIAIGRHFFFKEAAIDWDHSILVAHGIEFGSVKISKRGSAINTARQHAPKKIGRPPVVQIIREIARELNTLKRFDGFSIKEIERLIGNVARERYPLIFRKPTWPSKKTINQAFRAEELVSLVPE